MDPVIAILQIIVPPGAFVAGFLVGRINRNSKRDQFQVLGDNSIGIQAKGNLQVDVEDLALGETPRRYK